MEDSDRGLTFFDGCIRAYGAATRHMMEVWQDVTDKPMDTLSGYPRDRFREALGYFVRAMKSGDAAVLRAKLDEATRHDGTVKSLIEDSLASPAEAFAPDIDDVPPSIFKKAIWAEALNCVGDEPVDVDLEVFLRAVVSRVIGEMGWKRRFNVGENRHFPRMVQWLREVEEETAGDEGFGLHLMNRGSAGRVASYPAGPHNLKVRLDADWL
ncbi:hypothetical protein SLG_17450 [Sphingobium sp. SYK-6]|uniref:hypothetical protein n=1 Tax=Sphingobium sp. (strain NBRC 103272 / SYK-6) TaxID=627192 RepID=UPI00022771AE|nr:hypothetical protein [Sphingobium sp. SYK-6]BAK66420.1 hypothetical protein SLG_17450 [Sphingobium sp. SYK-6]